MAGAPALDAAAVEDRAGVVDARRDGDGAGAEADGAQARHLAGDPFPSSAVGGPLLKRVVR